MQATETSGATDAVPAVQKQRELIAPGWYKDMDNERYHGSAGHSSSDLKTLLKQSPMHLRHKKGQSNEPTANMLMGSAVHTLVLEPHLADAEIAVMPDLNLRTKAGKEAREEFESIHKGKIILNAEKFDEANLMARAVHDHEIAHTLFQDCVMESSIFWWYKSSDEFDVTDYKEMVKVRPDAICKAYPVVPDLKTCADGSYSGFIRAVENFHYHVSAAMYLDGINRCNELLAELKHYAYLKFAFVCVENYAPYAVSVYELSPEYLEIGRLKYQAAMQRLHNGRQEDWPGYPDGIRRLDPPLYSRNGHIV